jgi:hypothetical protein
LPTTLEDLADLDSGLILIVGGRRSGKTTICETILRRWTEHDVNYRYFGHSPALSIHKLLYSHDNRWTGPRGRYGGLPSSETLLKGCRGYQRVLIDEPRDDLRPEEVSFSGVLVLATSDPQIWMTQRASWIVASEGLHIIHVEQGLYRPPASRISPTIWERLLIGVF